MNSEQAIAWWNGNFEECPICDYSGIVDCADIETRSGQQTIAVWCESCGWEDEVVIEIKLVEKK